MSANQTSSMATKNFHFETYSIAAIFVGALVFFLTLLVAPYYTSGDQEHYIKAYDGVAGLSLVEGFSFYTDTLSSTEIVHYSLISLGNWFGAEKNFLMAISNAILAYLSMRCFEKLKASVLVAVAIVVLNFYSIVLYFSAERLKFGYIFLLM